MKKVEINECQYLTDITPLKDCTELESLSIPKAVRDIEFLRHMPALKKLSFSQLLIPVAEFWKEYDAQKATGPK